MSEDLIEVMIKYFSKPPYQEDFERAKTMFTKAVGIVVEEHPYFDTWISGFFEWYLIDYKMLNLGIPPIYLYQRIFHDGMDPKAIEFCHNLEKSTLELMEIQSVSGQKVKATNRFTNENLEFVSHENTALLQKGDLIVTRIMRLKSGIQSAGVVWHFTSEAAPIINKKMELVKNAYTQEMFLYELMKRKTQSEIYSHVPLDQIFAWKTGEFKIPGTPR